MVPPPRTLPGFPAAVRAWPKTPRPGGGLRMRWKDASSAIYEWDYGTERLTIEHDVPASLFGEVRSLAEVPDTDREALGSYPLSLPAIRMLASWFHAPLNVDAYDWFLEPIAPGS